MGRINVISLILVDSDVQHVDEMTLGNACGDAGKLSMADVLQDVFLECVLCSWNWVHSTISVSHSLCMRVKPLHVLGRSPHKNYKNDLDDQT